MDNRRTVAATRYGPKMHTERTGRDEHETVEVYDTRHCTGCQTFLASPHVLRSHLPCSCAGSGGHRTITCLGCGTVHYEPAHEGGDGIGSLYG